MVTGNVDPHDLLKALEPVELRAKATPVDWKSKPRPWTTPVKTWAEMPPPATNEEVSAHGSWSSAHG